MARHKNTNWILPEGEPNETGGRSHSWESIQSSLLMDLRDELQELNRLLHCSNFLRIPSELRDIRLNTAKLKGAKKK